MSATLANAADPAVRQSGIGGSDSAAICGLNRFRAPLDVYLEKRGLTEDLDSEPAEWGRILEPVVLRQYAIRRKTWTLGRNENGEATLWDPDGFIHADAGSVFPELVVDVARLLDTQRDPSHPWRMCHPDGYAVTPYPECRPVRIIEGKTTSAFRGSEWGDDETDDVPEEYVVQCVHNSGVIGAASGLYLPVDIPVLIGGQKFRVYTVNYRRSLDEKLVGIEGEFWKAAQDGEPPPATPDERGKRGLSRMFPEDAGEERIVPPDSTLHDAMLELKAARLALDEAEARKTSAENGIKESMGTAAKLIGDGWSVTWKRTKDGSKTDWEAAFRWAMRGSPKERIDNAIDEHTTIKPGYRVFRPRFKEE